MIIDILTHYTGPRIDSFKVYMVFSMQVVINYLGGLAIMVEFDFQVALVSCEYDYLKVAPYSAY